MTCPGPSRTSASRRPGCARDCLRATRARAWLISVTPTSAGASGTRQSRTPSWRPHWPRTPTVRLTSRGRTHGPPKSSPAAASGLPRRLTSARPGPPAGACLAYARGDLAGVLLATEPVRATRLLDVGGRPGIFNWRAIEADALIGLGRLDDAETMLNEFEGAIPPAGLASAALTLARCRGNLALASGDAPQAEAAFSRAHEIQPEVPMPFEHALLSLDDGRRLRAAQDRPAAVAQLEKAHRIFSDLGADPYLQACATELAALQVTAATSSPAALLGLSRAELAVARLVATGLTNREVASQLYVSVKTVEYHLRNSYIKLDITSRRALAALLH